MFEGKLKQGTYSHRAVIYTAGRALLVADCNTAGLRTFREETAIAAELVRRWNAFEGLYKACEAMLKAPESLPLDNQYDAEKRRYRNQCMAKIDKARKEAKAAIKAAGE